MSWKDSDEVTTTFGTIQNVKQENYVQGYYDGVDERRKGDTAYNDGIKAGQRIEREYLLDFIAEHEGIPLSVEDFVVEINARYKAEQNETLRRLGL
jgi:hypothetical protein